MLSNLYGVQFQTGLEQQLIIGWSILLKKLLGMENKIKTSKTQVNIHSKSQLSHMSAYQHALKCVFPAVEGRHTGLEWQE